MSEIVLEFNLDKWLVGYSGWIINDGVECPHCGKYHGESFIPDELEYGKTDYITKCKKCGREVIVRMPSVEFNDKLIDAIKGRLQIIEGEVSARAKGHYPDKCKTLKEFMEV